MLDVALLHERAHRMADELMAARVSGEAAGVEQGLNTLHDLNAELAQILYRLAHESAA